MKDREASMGQIGSLECEGIRRRWTGELEQSAVRTVSEPNRIRRFYLYKRTFQSTFTLFAGAFPVLARVIALCRGRKTRLDAS